MTLRGGRTPDGNPAGSDGGHGGAIFLNGGVAITNSTLSGNATGNGVGAGSNGGAGGAIFVGGVLTITDSTLAGNVTGNGTFGGGSGGAASAWPPTPSRTPIPCSTRPGCSQTAARR